MKTTALIIAFIALVSCNKKIVTPEAPSFPVKIITASQKEADIFIEALGHVESMTTVNILSRIEGELTGVFFKQGQEVKQGDLLFTIDPLLYEAELKKAQAVVEQNQAELTLAEQKVARYKILTQDEYYSQIDYETLQANYAQTAATLKAAEADRDLAAINLNYCWIYAPVDGMVGILQIDYGNLIGNLGGYGINPIAVLNQMTPIYVTFSVPESSLPTIQKYRRLSEQPLTVKMAFEDFTQDIFQGTLDIINNEVDTATGQIKLRALYYNDHRDLWPGQFIRTRLVLTSIPNAVLIPYTAVQLTSDGPVVFVVKEDNTVDQRKIKLGQREDTNIVVLSGIQTGERIVLEGQLNLTQGTKIHERQFGGS